MSGSVKGDGNQNRLALNPRNMIVHCNYPHNECNTSFVLRTVKAYRGLPLPRPH